MCLALPQAGRQNHSSCLAETMAALERLRGLVLDCVSKHLHASAVFFADKLVTLSEGAPEDVFLLAQAHCYSGAHARALALLRAEGLTTASPRFLHLTCSCLVELQQHEEALAVLGEAGAPFRVDAGGVGAENDGVATTAACEVLRGRVYLALENRSAAARCFKVCSLSLPRRRPHLAPVLSCCCTTTTTALPWLTLIHAPLRLRWQPTRCATTRSSTCSAASWCSRRRRRQCWYPWPGGPGTSGWAACTTCS